MVTLTALRMLSCALRALPLAYMSVEGGGAQGLVLGSERGGGAMGVR